MLHFSDVNFGKTIKIKKVIRNTFSDEKEKIMPLLILLILSLCLYTLLVIVIYTIFFSISILISICNQISHYGMIYRGGSRTAATSKMEHFVIIVNSRKPLTIITKRSILDVAAALDPPLI